MSKVKISICAVVFMVCAETGFFCSNAIAQALTGTVTDSATGSPIKNATVTLKTAGRATLTDEQGRFSFSENTVSRSFPQLWNTSGMVELLNQRLKFSITENAIPVSITMHDLSGRLLQTLANGIYAKGDYSITASAKKSFHAGIVLLHSRIGESEQTIRVLLRPCHSVTLSFSPSVTPSPCLFLSSSTDTLITDRYGYFSEIRTTSTSAQNLAIRLRKMPENAIVPPGMKLVNGDVFIMGSQNGEAIETPEHIVSLSSYYIDTSEVTQIVFSLLMTVQPWNSSEVSNPKGKGPNQPAWGMNWYDAALYCNERSKKDGLDTVYAYKGKSGMPGNGCRVDSMVIDYAKTGYRLPTEAEWEYSCGGGYGYTYFWGNNKDSATYFAWYSANSNGMTHDVAKKMANTFTLYDLTGNVEEWTNDWLGSYPSGEVEDPIGPKNGMMKCVRGCNALNSIEILRVTSRPSASIDARSGLLGFRVALPKR